MNIENPASLPRPTVALVATIKATRLEPTTASHSYGASISRPSYQPDAPEGFA